MPQTKPISKMSKEELDAEVKRLCQEIKDNAAAEAAIIEGVRKLTNEELDRAVAVEVMGWVKRDFVSDSTKHFFQSEENAWVYYGGRHWSPSTNPTDDHAVLVHVAENWDDEKLWVMEFRYGEMISPRQKEPPRRPPMFYYQPGDDARAALITERLFARKAA